MSPIRKRVAIGIVVIGSALIGQRVVALMTGEMADEFGDSDVVQAVAPRTDSPRASRRMSSATVAADPSAGEVRLDLLAVRQRELAVHDDAGEAATQALFGAVSWQPAPTPAQRAAAAAPPPPPVAPPFPYAYLGGLSEDGVRTAFFARGVRVLPVQVGDTVDAVYRVDEMTEKLMTLTYLPLNQSLTHALGDQR